MGKHGQLGLCCELSMGMGIAQDRNLMSLTMTSKPEIIHSTLEPALSWLSGKRLMCVSVYANMVVLECEDRLLIQALRGVATSEGDCWRDGAPGPYFASLFERIEGHPISLSIVDGGHLEVCFRDHDPLLVLNPGEPYEWVQIIRPGEAAVA